jgi:hypothetical protein
VERSEIVEVEMPDGTVISAQVVVADLIADVSAGRAMKLDDARDTIASFVRWAVAAVAVPAEDGAPVPAPAPVTPPGMNLSRIGLEFGLSLAVKSGTVTSAIVSVGGQASAVVKLEWERPGAVR